MLNIDEMYCSWNSISIVESHVFERKIKFGNSLYAGVYKFRQLRVKKEKKQSNNRMAYCENSSDRSLMKIIMKQTGQGDLYSSKLA